MRKSQPLKNFCILCDDWGWFDIQCPRSIAVAPYGRVSLPKRMIFLKSSERPLTSPPWFSENYFAIVFWKKKKALYFIKNLRHKFLDWKDSPPPWKFSENSSVLVAWPIPKKKAAVPFESCSYQHNLWEQWMMWLLQASQTNIDRKPSNPMLEHT